MVKKLTKRKLRAWIKEEKKSSREYASYGYHLLALEEKHHAEILTKILKNMK